MRQAGRCLPEYRELRLKHSFLDLVRTPELATEVTLQPIRRFAFDAAIIFSDILVIPEALGLPYHFDEKGMKMERLVKSMKEISRLDPVPVPRKLSYVAEALALTRRKLGAETALIGFAGSPWTLACYMIEGTGSREFTEMRRLAYEEPKLLDALLAKLSDSLVRYLKMQIKAGADAVQIFDSLGGALPPDLFPAFSARWITRVIKALKSPVPVIVFSKGVHANWNDLAATGANVVGVDWGVRLSDARSSLPKRIALQGNLDPAILLGPPAAARRAARRILDEMKGRPGHVFNLGHGVPPEARLETMAAVLETVRSCRAS